MDKTKRTQPGLRSTWLYRGRSLSNLLRMGHCAPTVMQTLLDVSGAQQEWLIKLSAGMPGGIGNTGFECGAITSPLVYMGLRCGLHEMDRGLPVIFDKGHALCQDFLECHKTFQCKQIRGQDRFPRHCIRPVCLAPERCLAATSNNGQAAIPAEIRESYSRIYSYWTQNNFHCAQAVLDQLHYTPSEHQELFDAVSAFMGGTLFMGMTCSALTAGVMAVGLRSGEIENSPPRVIRMIARMTTGGNAFDETINKFNRSMNAGYRMSKWFVKEFGSTQCRAITQCDFSTQAGVSNYLENDCVTRCREIAQKVAERVQNNFNASVRSSMFLVDRA
ncbi:MAG: C_GCAxxG_C_C family protein [Chloroflexi bacterium]|nr:C_GCAxxG_C_C family protein [Chloroflexota bacterium]